MQGDVISFVEMLFRLDLEVGLGQDVTYRTGIIPVLLLQVVPAGLPITTVTYL